MLTYDFENVEGPVYEYIYNCIKKDILSGIIKPDEKLPSKRTFAKNNGLSTITIQNAYDQLISEGYVYTLPKKGYYAAKLNGIASKPIQAMHVNYDINVPKEEVYEIDISKNNVSSDSFPFSIWAKVSRAVISNKKDELMEPAPFCGIWDLREAIAEHLKSFRGMIVDPNQIIIGAGTEYLYGLLVELLGTDKKYVIESPGYKKLVQIYMQRGIRCGFAAMDKNGVTVEGLEKSDADVAHICPNHHFPTGITIPASRRYEILAWANDNDTRYIIEDDYDSEFRIEGRPIPTLFSIDACEKVIYMNTFSKSLSPTIRISYMVLPVHLANELFGKLNFYSSTVSNFEQYTMAEFIKQGYFEKHINRMRLYYMRKRQQVLEILKNNSLYDYCNIIENDSGLHFLIELKTDIADETIKQQLKENNIGIRFLSDYDLMNEGDKAHYIIINYSNLDIDNLEHALNIVKDILKSDIIKA